mmetsp:Transcript_7507/g.22226  ORF Transcript_7507/g.22226 Transcript_7507/m.22226 type:complete len:352 (-) Transcript_7507:1002-2057(-)
MFGRAPISTPSSHAHVHALTSCGVSARCAQRAPTYQSSVSLCAGRLCWRLRLRFRAPPEPGSQPPASPPPSSVPSPAAPRARLLPPGVQLRRPLRLPPEARVCPPPLLRARPLRLGRRRLEHAHVDGRGRVGGREERVRRPLEVLVVRVAAGGVALGRRLHTAQAGQGGALGQPRVEQPGRGEPLRLRVRAARRELAVAAVGEDPRLRTVPVQHARAAPARLARSHPRARARRRRKRRRRPATRATSLGRAGVHAVGGPTGKGPRKVACQCPWGARPLLAPCAEGRLYSPQHVSTSQFMPAPRDAKPYAQPRSCIGGCDCPCASSQRASCRCMLSSASKAAVAPAFRHRSK